MAEIHIWQPASGGDSLADASWDTLAPAKQATGQGTFAGVPSNLQTITIGSQEYRWVTSLGSCAANDVLIGGDAEACRDNLLSAILATAADSGVKWCAGTAKNTDVTALANGTLLIDLTSIKYGTGPNSVATTETSTGFVWGDTTLVDGDTYWTTNDAEVVFNNGNHSAMTDNLDWSELLDPAIAIAKITKQADNFSLIGSAGTPWVILPKADGLINLLGVGAIYLEAFASVSTPPNLIVAGPELVVVSGKLSSIHVIGGGRIECSAEMISTAGAGGSVVTVDSARAILLLLDSTKQNPTEIIAKSGTIVNDRTLETSDHVRIIDGYYIQKGQMNASSVIEIVGQGSLDIQPSSIAGGATVALFLISGRTTFANSEFDIVPLKMVIGKSASVEFGPTAVQPLVDLIDLRKSHP